MNAERCVIPTPRVREPKMARGAPERSILAASDQHNGSTLWRSRISYEILTDKSRSTLEELTFKSASMCLNGFSRRSNEGCRKSCSFEIWDGRQEIAAGFNETYEILRLQTAGPSGSSVHSTQYQFDSDLLTS